MSSIRLYLNKKIEKTKFITLSDKSVHYLSRVMRLKEGDSFFIFNGYEGEWEVEIKELKKIFCTVVVKKKIKAQSSEKGINLVFSLIKHTRQNFLVEKAVELGVFSFHPIITDHTIVRKINADRVQSNIQEAAEQSGRITIPKLHRLVNLSDLLLKWPKDKVLLVCNEHEKTPMISTKMLKHLSCSISSCGALIGPEGGFSEKELDSFSQYKFIKLIRLSSNILRSETAAITAIAILNGFINSYKLSNDI